MAKLKLTLVRSYSAADKRQIANLQSLGLRKMHQSVVVESNPVTLGMIGKVNHLVTVEETK
ncbi:MAG: 50S ribosomal protein L30 [Bacteroidales bacterium]|nr:50S ribosomal protein L30 [Bacteroidales bacterium]